MKTEPSPEVKLLERMKFIRDSTFRNAASLRAIADDAVNEYSLTIKEDSVQYSYE